MSEETDVLTLIMRARDEASRSLNNVKGLVLGIGAAYLTWEAAKRVIGGIIEAASEQERQMVRLSFALRQYNIDVSVAIPLIEQMTASLKYNSLITKDQIEQGFERLISVGYNVTNSYRIMSVATDIASRTGREFSAVLDLIVKGGAGAQMQLRRIAASLNIVVEDGDPAWKILDKIAERTNGAAAAEMDTYAGSVKRLGDEFEELQESVGKNLVNRIAGLMEFIRTSIQAQGPVMPNLLGSPAELDMQKKQYLAWMKAFEKEQIAAENAGDDAVAEHYGTKIAQIGVQVQNIDAVLALHAGNIKQSFRDMLPPEQQVDTFYEGLRKLADETTRYDIINADLGTTMKALKISEDDAWEATRKLTDEIGDQNGIELANRNLATTSYRYDQVTHGVENYEAALADTRDGIQQQARSISQSLTPSIMGLLNGTKSLADIGKMFLANLIERIIEMTTELIMVKLLTKAYKDLAEAQGSVGKGGGGGFGIFGSLLGFLPGGNIIGGIGGLFGAAAGGGSAWSPSAAYAGGGTSISVYQGVVSEDFMRDTSIPQTQMAAKRKDVTFIATSDRFGRSNVFN